MLASSVGSSVDPLPKGSTEESTEELTEESLDSSSRDRATRRWWLSTFLMRHTTLLLYLVVSHIVVTLHWPIHLPVLTFWLKVQNVVNIVFPHPCFSSLNNKEITYGIPLTFATVS